MTNFYYNPNAKEFTKELLTLVCLGEVKPLPSPKKVTFNNGSAECIGHPEVFRSRWLRPKTTYAIQHHL